MDTVKSHHSRQRHGHQLRLCLCVRAIKGKRLELSKPLVYVMGKPRHARTLRSKVKGQGHMQGYQMRGWIWRHMAPWLLVCRHCSQHAEPGNRWQRAVTSDDGVPDVCCRMTCRQVEIRWSDTERLANQSSHTHTHTHQCRQPINDCQSQPADDGLAARETIL